MASVDSEQSSEKLVVIGERSRQWHGWVESGHRVVNDPRRWRDPELASGFRQADRIVRARNRPVERSQHELLDKLRSQPYTLCTKPHGASPAWHTHTLHTPE